MTTEAERKMLKTGVRRKKLKTMKRKGWKRCNKRYTTISRFAKSFSLLKLIFVFAISWFTFLDYKHMMTEVLIEILAAH